MFAVNFATLDTCVCVCQGTAAFIRNAKPVQRAINSFFTTSSVGRSSSGKEGSRVNNNENRAHPPVLKIISKQFSIGGSGHDREGRVMVLELKEIWLVNVYVSHSI